jgi:hypothetical protein
VRWLSEAADAGANSAAWNTSARLCLTGLEAGGRGGGAHQDGGGTDQMNEEEADATNKKLMPI